MLQETVLMLREDIANETVHRFIALRGNRYDEVSQLLLRETKGRLVMLDDSEPNLVYMTIGRCLISFK